MLCNKCSEITLHFGDEDTEVEIRRYSNLSDLQSTAGSCHFCDLLYEEAQKLEHPDMGTYCKQSWGIEFFNRLLEQSPITVYHNSCEGEHNVVIRCHLDAVNAIGFHQGPIGYLWHEMLGGIFVAADSDLATRVAGRPFNTDISKLEQIALAKSLYDECQLAHNTCNVGIDPEFMPTRLLDLAPDISSPGWIRLVVVPERMKSAYATLSYCWGRAQNLRLTSETLSSFIDEGLALSRLPATIRDACELCVGVGIRYLWVCSLCIVQDLERDWIRESSMMGAIYNSSNLTISAASGQHCAAGIFETRGTCCVRGRLVPYGFKEPTERRGWTLQETLLSRRLLIRGTAEISWQCAKTQWSQGGSVLKPLEHIKDIFPCPPLKYPINPGSGSLYRRDFEETSLGEIWKDLVQNYSCRKLSLSKDKLPAISGIAKWLSRYSFVEDTYLAGLWLSELPICLLWYNTLILPADEDESIRPTTYRAPSWTWASIDTKYLQWLEVACEDNIAKILDYSLLHKSSDPFGEVRDGFLDIEASMKQGWLVPNRTHPEHFDFWDDNWKSELADQRPTPLNRSLGWVHLDVYDVNDLCRVGLVTAETRVRACQCLKITSEAGLLIKLVQEQNQHSEQPANKSWQRLGIVKFKKEATGWWHNAAKERIRLI